MDSESLSFRAGISDWLFFVSPSYLFELDALNLAISPLPLAFSRIGLGFVSASFVAEGVCSNE